MAFDGIMVNHLVRDLNSSLQGGRIQKIYQPESDELIIPVKTADGTKRLLLSASASLPIAYILDGSIENPKDAPNFSMLLRKHLNGGKIVSIEQPGLERIMIFNIEHLNELGDLCQKKLIAEFMGKHSNIIFTDNDLNIIDSIKRIPASISSVRVVLPGQKYFIPNTLDKIDPVSAEKEDFYHVVFSASENIVKAIYTSFTGFSSLIATEMVHRAGIDSRSIACELTDMQKSSLYEAFKGIVSAIKNSSYCDVIYYENGAPREYAPLELTIYRDLSKKVFDSASSVLYSFYNEKNELLRMKQRSADLKSSALTLLQKASKKYDIQRSDLEKSMKRDKYKLYGELLTAFGYGYSAGEKEFTCENYYDENKEIHIPLDPDFTPIENAKRYFERYTKLKRTFESVSQQLKKTQSEIDFFNNILASIDMATCESDLLQVRKELQDAGFVKSHSGKGKKAAKILSKPLKYVSSSGLEILVGKNNIQNEELTLKVADATDWWFHAKQIHGSHVILKCNGEEPDDAAFEEAARLAAYYSAGRDSDKVEIDYIQRKYIKKPAGSAPGYVIYHTNYSMVAETDISGITAKN